MIESKIKFSILITTKNRLVDLKVTLENLSLLINNEEVECLVYDDASTDGTFDFIKRNYPKIILLRNNKTLGLIHNRNILLEKCNGEYAISIDDDLHFLTPENPLEVIETFFKKNKQAGVLSFRVYWDKKEPDTYQTYQKPVRIKNFLGGANVWRMSVWRQIPNYPEWFIFYGEEDFASYQLFKIKKEIWYCPEILTLHRVDLLERKQQKDYIIRTRRSIRSGWFLMGLFYPIRLIPKRFLYTLYIQLKNKVFKRDFRAALGILLALFDVLIHIPKIIKNKNRLTIKEFKAYNELNSTEIYWYPENDK
ncbi:glycosyltransferase family 2 protein [Flavobacterium oreochromis]|uniref:Glycosyl transferase n=2 Tax=Flavobacterium TaxID=237 RepID=A0A246G7X3_9FLAO|nr:glycosyltransferase [Flavobacterium oreochromis]OWP74104.1 glycosyl transferase [Flavobacterium oreochromis]OWP74727.1 glycosyl transferase [Flavobacterium oreochromis]POR20567.1 glycosyl transferase [Flavobacterium columnare]